MLGHACRWRSIVVQSQGWRRAEQCNSPYSLPEADQMRRCLLVLKTSHVD